MYEYYSVKQRPGINLRECITAESIQYDRLIYVVLCEKCNAKNI